MESNGANKMTATETRRAFEITYRRNKGRKVFTGEQFHTSEAEARRIAGRMLDESLCVLLDVRELTAEECARRGVPHTA